MPSPAFHLALANHSAALGIVGNVDPMVAMVPGDEPVAVLQYSTREAYSATVSANVEAFRALDGFAFVESWAVERSGAVPLTYLRYAPAPAVESPRPIAPVASAPASHQRRRQ